MSRRSDFLSPEGLRVDGRRAGEVRRLRARMGVEQHADGSAYVEQGNTKVLVTVFGPHEVTQRSKASHDRALLTVETTALPFANGQHRPQGRTDRGSTEMSAAIRKTFEAVVQTTLYARSQIDISISVMQVDGGVRSAAFNATTLALVDAGVAMEDFVCACSVGSIGGALLLDPNGQEDQAGAELSVAYLPRAERIGYVQLESKIALSTLEEATNFTVEGCRQIYDVLREVAQIRMQELLHTRGGVLNG